MRKITLLLSALTLSLSSEALVAQESEESEPPSLGDLFQKVKEIKVPDSVSNLPTQITELKEAYLDTAKTVEELKQEVTQLRNEVYALRRDNEVLREAVGAKVEKKKLSDLMKPVEVSSSDLVSAFETNQVEAAAVYQGKYLKVIGYVDRFEAGTQAIEIFLKSDESDRKVRCVLPTGSNLYVDVLPTQGRLVSRNDRRTLLSAGQPVTIVGTCTGFTLNVEMEHCIIDGLVEPKAAEKED